MEEGANALSEHPVLPALQRQSGKQGSRQSRYMRRDKHVPSLLFGKDEDGSEVNVPISVSELDVNRLIRIRGRSIECTLLTIKMEDGKSVLATPKGLQMCPINDRPLSLNFWVYRPGNRLNVPFKFINEELSTDLKRGSFLMRINKSMSITCAPGVPPPPSIAVDLAGKVKGQVITLRDVQLPAGVLRDKRTEEGLVIARVSTNRG